MALTTAEQSYIRGKIDRLKAQKNMRKLVDALCRLERDVDRNGWDAYLAGLYVTGGGFFLCGQYGFGLLTAILGYSISIYGGWIVLRNLLSYVADFERDWRLALFVFVGTLVYTNVTAIFSAVMAVRMRERASFELELLRAEIKTGGSVEREST